MDSEQRVGIELFLNDENKLVKGGSLKHRYSDFIVNEVDPSGKVVFLSTKEGDLNDPYAEDRKEEEKKEQAAQDALTEEEKKLVVPINQSQIDLVKSSLDSDNADILLSFIDRQNKELGEKNEILYFFHIDDKEKRTAIHKLIREQFPTLETHTTEIEGERKITCFLAKAVSKTKRKKMDMRTNDNNSKQMLHLTMMKENIESMQAVHHLSKMIKK